MTVISSITCTKRWPLPKTQKKSLFNATARKCKKFKSNYCIVSPAVNIKAICTRTLSGQICWKPTLYFYATKGKSILILTKSENQNGFLLYFTCRQLTDRHIYCILLLHIASYHVSKKLPLHCLFDVTVSIYVFYANTARDIVTV